MAVMRPRKALLRATWIIAATILVATNGLAQTADPGLARLRGELERLSAIARGKVGVGIIHLETGRELFLNGNDYFPMA